MFLRKGMTNRLKKAVSRNEKRRSNIVEVCFMNNMGRKSRSAARRIHLRPQTCLCPDRISFTSARSLFSER